MKTDFAEFSLYALRFFVEKSLVLEISWSSSRRSAAKGLKFCYYGRNKVDMGVQAEFHPCRTQNCDVIQDDDYFEIFLLFESNVTN